MFNFLDPYKQVSAIHFQFQELFLKSVKYYSKDQTPSQQYTGGNNESSYQQYYDCMLKFLNFPKHLQKKVETNLNNFMLKTKQSSCNRAGYYLLNEKYNQFKTWLQQEQDQLIRDVCLKTYFLVCITSLTGVSYLKTPYIKEKSIYGPWHGQMVKIYKYIECGKDLRFRVYGLTQNEYDGKYYWICISYSTVGTLGDCPDQFCQCRMQPHARPKLELQNQEFEYIQNQQPEPQVRQYTCTQTVLTRRGNTQSSEICGELVCGDTIIAEDAGLNDGVYWITYMGASGRRVYTCRYDPYYDQTYWE